MHWQEITKSSPPAGKYVVRTVSSIMKTVRHLDVVVSYDNKGKQHWHCSDQTVTHYLNENEKNN